MRTVKWMTTMNYSIDGGGGTTRLHLTESEGLQGRTLCGRNFPARKGWPTAARYCAVCLRKAGLDRDALAALSQVPSEE